MGLNFRQFSLRSIGGYIYLSQVRNTMCSLFFTCFSWVIFCACALVRFVSQNKTKKKSLVKVRKTSWLGLMFWLARSRMEMVSNFLCKIAIDKKRNHILRCCYKHASTAATWTAGGDLTALLAVMTSPLPPSTSWCESQLSSIYNNVNPVFFFLFLFFFFKHVNPGPFWGKHLLLILSPGEQAGLETMVHRQGQLCSTIMLQLQWPIVTQFTFRFEHCTIIQFWLIFQLTFRDYKNITYICIYSSYKKIERQTH